MKKRAGSKSWRSSGLLICCLIALTSVYVLHTRSAAPGPNPSPAIDQAQADADLIGAVKANDLEQVKRLLNNGASPNAREEGLTPLMYAAGKRRPNLNIIAALLDAGADLKAGNGSGERALVFAVKGGDGSVLRLLLERGADVNAQRMDGNTALHEAGLLLYGADINLQNNYGRTPLYDAALDEDPEVAIALINMGADVNAKTAFGVTPLMVAATLNRPVLAQMLIERGADVNAVDTKNMTALKAAVASGSYEIVKLLRKAKAKK
jgi:ankyrin repeat protein